MIPITVNELSMQSPSFMTNYPTRCRVKFCGFTQVEHIQQAVNLGVDAVGLVFYPPSPRAVNIEQAQALVKAVPVFVSVVALVVNMPENELMDLAHAVPFDVIQFHGDESPEDCQRLAKLVNKRWFKALRINGETDTPEAIHQTIIAFAQAGASAILLDAYHRDKFGGTGERFDWNLIPNNSPLPIILAGGLTPENVATVHKLPIDGVDVSGGIEFEKGKKDLVKMIHFMQGLKG